MKRLTDTLIALIGLPVAVPEILLCMAAIRLSSRGPAIFRHTWIGRNEAPFTCYKLRTMYVDTHDAPSHETAVSAGTPIGA